MREPLAMGLFNTLSYAKSEDDLARRDALLEELRELAKAHPEDPAVREQLAKGLFNTLNDAKSEDDLARRDALLEELRELAKAHSEEPFLGAAANTLHAKSETMSRRDALLRNCASCGAPRKLGGAAQLAMGLSTI